MRAMMPRASSVPVSCRSIAVRRVRSQRSVIEFVRGTRAPFPVFDVIRTADSVQDYGAAVRDAVASLVGPSDPWVACADACRTGTGEHRLPNGLGAPGTAPA